MKRPLGHMAVSDTWDGETVGAEACIWSSALATRFRFPGERLGRRLSSPHTYVAVGGSPGTR